MKDPYLILGVSRNASDEEIKSAYRTLAKEHHPDKGGSHEKFAEINAAYDSIKNKESRDKLNHHEPSDNQFGGFYRNNPFENSPFGPGGMFNFENIFAQQFNRAVRNSDVSVTLYVTIDDVLHNATKIVDVKLPNGQSRQVEIKIPVGVTENSKVKYHGFGGNINSAEPGDLIVTFKIKKDDRFIISEYDIIMKLSISLGEALIGTEKTITIPDNKQIKLKIRAGTQDGTKLRIPESGLPRRGDSNGNLYIEIKVKIPELSAADLDKPLRELLFKS
jgi:curved DNA-binding protein